MLFGRSQLASFMYTVDVPGKRSHDMHHCITYAYIYIIGITPNNRESAADVPSPEFLMDLTLERSTEIHYGPAINRYRSGMFDLCMFISAHAHTNVYVCAHGCMYAHTHARACTRIHKHMFAYTYIHTHK